MSNLHREHEAELATLANFDALRIKDTMKFDS